MKTFSFFNHGMILIFFLSFLFILIQDASSQNQSVKTDPNNRQEVNITGTEMRPLFSSILNQELILFIKLPASYDANTNKVYPCWYFTDGNRSFPMIANFEGIFEVPGPTEPEIFIIGIGYRIHDMADWAAWRTRDLTPTNIPALDTSLSRTLSKMSGRNIEVKSGGAEKFLEFIVKEVFPFVESNYRVSNTDRGIGGYSYGGLFSLFVLFRQPELFSNYYAGSPSISYNRDVLFTYEKKYACTHNDLNAKVFMTAGGSEDSIMVTNIKKMASQLESRNYPGLKVETHVFPDETHLSCYPSSIMRAFRVLYKR